MQGLITKERKNLDPAAAPFAKDPSEITGLREGASLVEVVRFIMCGWQPLLIQASLAWKSPYFAAIVQFALNIETS